MDHNLAISDHQPAAAHCAAHLQKANSHRAPHRAPLYSVRHSPQFMGAFHSFGLECFIYSANIWTWICLNLHCSVCTIVDCTAPAAALALVLNCSSSLSHWPGNTPTYQKCFVTRPAGASLLWLNHWSRLQPVGHTFNHLSCCSLFKPVNNIECKNAIHRKTIIGGTLKFHKNSWQVLLNA